MNLPHLDPVEFDAVFEAIHGTPPFPWQRRLAAILAAGGSWPPMLDLPTGAGKTAALDVALFHLALQAGLGEARQAPLRVVFVVDRRIIVDAAAERADRIAVALMDAKGESPLARMAARLRHLAGPNAPALLVARLRGGLPREGDWARSPGQPTILCSTVDQAGSRLLFRGYGVSDTMKPVHAGLLGSDALFLLDEAHLAAPFVQTLRRVAAYRSQPWCEERSGPWQFVSLSATQESTGECFGLDDEDRAHPILRARLAAPKPARLRLLDASADGPGHAKAIAAEALSLFDPGRPSRIAVVVNRVALAREVFTAVKRGIGDAADVVLLTGRIRGVDRDDVIAGIRPRLELGAAAGGRSLIVVATQTIEAGADFDFDALVTQVAPLDALRQRFGRLNRSGRDFEASATIIATKSEVSARANDPVYGDRGRRTWEWLLDAAGKPTRSAREARCDFGIAALECKLAAEPSVASDLSMARPQAPVLRPADVTLLSWTAPVPAVDPAIALFLHGPQAGSADVSIVWRADITEATVNEAASDRESLGRVVSWVALAPPHAAETLVVPLWAARAWLTGQADSAAGISDIEGAPGQDIERQPARSRPALRWAGAESEMTGVAEAPDLQPGDVVVVPATYGGCDEFGWNPSSLAAVIDLGDERRSSPRGQTRRLHPALLGEKAWARVARLLAVDPESEGTDLIPALLAADLIPAPGGWEALRPEGYPGAILRQGRQDGLIAVTEDDASGTSAAAPVGLAAHTAAVTSTAQGFAIAAGLSRQRAGDIALAARLHDAGKADPRFQAMLFGGDRLLAALNTSEPLAKSGRMRKRVAMEAARIAAGLPKHWRHEAQSVTRASADPDLATAKDPELVLWLIGTHHGHGRPLFPHHDPREPADAPGPQRLDFQFRGHDWAQIFERLKDRYGPWELARMEAVLRLADHRASAEGAA